MKANLEHINLTVSDPLVTAYLLVELFDWRIRWKGDAINGGFSVHVGDDSSYLALYSPDTNVGQTGDTYNLLLGLNHLGIVVDNLEDAESRIVAAGYKTFSHGDYKPGKRFYFNAPDNLEIEVVSYQSDPTISDKSL